ncbi:hypothetical protein J1TS5_04030 [Paenibacillus macerans]|uniref:hypothetical protein n=1 Tax=Paenibacillus macerans TaxID=44252 RepID=UPI001B242007|nr:hypothetical protein [Paenibacillus macerans]GIP08233.1 hypothetical protein J1TS5_04030 [Paenibacillus macerans]
MKRFWNKTTRRIVILGMALLMAAAAVVLQNSIVKRQTTTEQVWVATDNIQPYSLVKDKLEKREVVKSEVPEDAVFNLAELEGEEWVTGEIGIPKGVPVSKSLLVIAKDSKYGQNLELIKGEMFIGVQTDQVRSAGDLIKPGTVADAYVYIGGDNQTTAQLITPEDDPLLKGLLIQERQNQNGYDPQQDESQNPIPAIAIVKTSNPKVAATLIKYQEEGRVYFTPTGVKLENQSNEVASVK